MAEVRSQKSEDRRGRLGR